LATNKKPLDEKIRDAAEEFRDPEIEYQLVAYLTRVNPADCGMMKKEWLSDVLLQDVYSVVSDLKITLSQPMLTNELGSRGFIGKGEEELYDEVIGQLYSVDTSLFNSKNTKHMMGQVLKMHETRAILTGCGEIIGSMANFSLADAKRKLVVLGRPVELVNPENAGMYLDDYESRVEDMTKKREEADNTEDGEVGIPTGVYRFDRLIGGLMKKEFGVIAGITGVGKTASLVNFGVHAWTRGHDVMIVSGEMPKKDMEFRIDSYLTQISGLKFRIADLEDSDYQKWDDTIQMYRAKQNNMLYVGAYNRRFTAESIERDILRIQEETGRKVEVVCADYINIMEPVSRGKGNWEDQAESIWDFKALVAENDLVGWTASQVKDEAYEKELFDSQDLKYARAISECAPIIAALIRSEKDAIENRMKLQIIKMRNAPLPLKPILLTPKLDIMRIHQDHNEVKSLKGRAPDTMDVKKGTPSARPRKGQREN